ncbi:MAG: hypothetical protein M0R46_09875 [Candidatus Muirbacterium halophilum]|nr:hypothetical protein [Candidatus Muirbacterium halophilum]
MQHNNNELCKLAMINDDKTFKYILYTSKNIDFNDVTCLLSNQKYDYVDLIEKDFSLKKIVDTKNNNLLHYAVYNNDFESVNYLALKNTKLKTLKNVENKLPMDYVTHANFRVANIVYVNTENLK